METDKKQNLVLAALALVGLGILASDLSSDMHFFSAEANRSTALMASAAVRNLLTVVAVVALFLRKKWAGFALCFAGILGLWRRSSYLLPIFKSLDDQTLMLVHSGADFVFRLLILAAGVSLLLNLRSDD